MGDDLWDVTGSNLDAYIVFVKSPTGTHGEMHLLLIPEWQTLLPFRVAAISISFPGEACQRPCSLSLVRLTATFNPHGCSKSEYHDD